MNVFDRLMMELKNKDYLKDPLLYNQLLKENDLNPDDTYDKSTMQKNLLWAVIDVLEMVSNDIDLMMSVETEFENRSDAYKNIESRIEKIKKRIASIPDPVVEENNSPFSFVFGRIN